MEFGKLFEIDRGNNVCPNPEYLSQLDKARTQRPDSLPQFDGTLAMDIVGEKSWWAHKNPSAPIPQKREQKRRESIPDDKDAAQHGVSGKCGIKDKRSKPVGRVLHSPPLEEGWLRPSKKMSPFRSGADGAVRN